MSILLMQSNSVKRKSEPPSSAGAPLLPIGGPVWTIDMLVRLAPVLNECVDILVDIDVVKLFSGLSRAYIYELEELDPKFPARAHVGRRAAWSFWGLQRWIRSKVQDAEKARKSSK
jgi:predicted DNA-binding transcriptional regulator AlpA